MSGTELSNLIKDQFSDKNKDYTILDYSNLKIIKIGCIQ